jgi:phosphopantothenoylcysteine decarboxylase/phosphopantothenate--cysteine ligase
MQQKNILLGITGGIAAYKSAELVRKFRASGVNVKVIMTKAAKQFITPLTLQTLSGNPVYADMFAGLDEFAVEHIELAKWADLILIAPATANFIARLALGLADDLLTTVCLASKAQIAIAPAMNVNMWLNAATQENVAKITARGVEIFGPTTGLLACGDEAIGKMLEPEAILLKIEHLCHYRESGNPENLVGKKILLTAGATQEAIDPVRFISNKSSGKMGYALATAATAAGAEVILVSGATNLPIPKVTKLIQVITAQEMLTAVLAEINNCEIFIAVAAVADFIPKVVAKHKLKKLTSLELQKNPDILATVAALPKPPFTVGFAAETENLLANAKTKLLSKKVDMIVANQVGANLGFDTEENSVTILTKDSKLIVLPTAKKTILAKQLLWYIDQYYENH